MSKTKTKLNPDALVGKTVKFKVPLRSDGDTHFRVDVRVMGVRKAFGRTDLRITPVAGDGEAHVTINSIEEVKP